MEFLSQEEIAKYQGVFDLLDKDKKGALDEEAIKAGMIALRLHPKDAEVRQMIKEADTSKTGRIDFTAFVNCLAGRMAKLDSEEDIIKAFNTFDRQDLGEIPSEELRKHLTTLGSKLSEKEIREVLKFGADEEGNFNYEKFTAVMLGKQTV
ncbi:calcium-dependent protein kinase [Balamuthia mandrillaris]